MYQLQLGLLSSLLLLFLLTFHRILLLSLIETVEVIILKRRDSRFKCVAVIIFALFLGLRLFIGSAGHCLINVLLVAG